MTDYTSTDAVHALVTAFESATLPHEAWTHQAHLTVAAWYVLWYGPRDALDHVRDGILRINAVQGVPQTPTRGYSETMTRRYLDLVAQAVARAGITTSLAEIVNRVVAECRDRRFPFA
jgi:hypothetical protein